MRRITKCIFLFVVLAQLFYPTNTYATAERTSYVGIGNIQSLESENLILSKNHQYSSYEYIIDKYDIDIVVNENNTFDITETITAYFNVPKHGIIRNIPLKNTITRLDGTTSSNRAQISNLVVDNKYTISKGNGNYKIKVGNSDRILTGEQTYVIKYTYNIGKDPVKDYDEFYYNIVGNEWDTVIRNVTFTIVMPKEFDSSKLGFSSGTKGAINDDRVKYSVTESKIVGSYTGVLQPGEGLTVRCELPEGYFVGAGYSISALVYLMFIIPVVGVFIVFLLWYKFGRDNRVLETVEFYPPNNINSLDAGFLYNGKAENKDVTSLLIYLASKGYIEIIDKTNNFNKINLSQEVKENANKKIIDLQNKIDEELRNNPNSQKIKYYENMLNIYKNIDTPIDCEQYDLKYSINKLKKDNGVVFRKLKDYDGKDINEQWFMEGLFEYNMTEVTNEMLYNKFYRTNNRILSNVNNKQNMDKVFEKRSSSKTIIVILLMIVSLLTTIVVPTVEYAGNGGLILTLFVCAFYMPFFGVGIFSKMSFKIRIFWLGFTIVHSLFFFSTLPIVEAITTDLIYFLGFILGILCLIGMIILFKLMPKRTQYGTEMLGKLKGFKNFLETAEKDKLELLVMQNPNYFFDILPYTYVLGVSNKWIKKFEFISLQAPNWYVNSNGFDVSTFGRFMNSTMSSAQTSMVSSPSNSSSGSSFGSSSGGGSSGGGSGGGGGSSW